MKMFRPFKNALLQFDFFTTTQYLRYKSQPEYKTFFGGIISLFLIITLICLFGSKLVDTTKKVIIFAETSDDNAADPTPFNISTYPQGQFMFGVEIWQHNLNEGKRFFDIVLTNVMFTEQIQSQNQNYPLEKCTLDHWQGFPEVQKDYERLKMNYWLCLPRNMKYNIQGKYSSALSKILKIAVKKCTNQSNTERPCASQDQIDDFFKANGPLFFTIYFINPLINPTSEDYLNFYMEDNNYIIFTDKLGSEGILFTEEYKITTDQSIWPFNSLREQSGGIITQFVTKNPYKIETDTYCSFTFSKSENLKVFDRSFQKLDHLLSYIGGLFGTMTIFLFFVRIYNEKAFEIELGSSLFHIQDAKQARVLKKYGFLQYLKVQAYKLLRFINCDPDWKRCKVYDQTNEQMEKQLDILYLLKRVIFLEKSIDSLLDDHQQKGIHLLQRLTLDEAKKNRKGFKAKKKIVQINDKTKQMRLPVLLSSPSNSVAQKSGFSPNIIFNSFQIDSINQNAINKVDSSVDSPIEWMSHILKKSSGFETRMAEYFEDGSSSNDASEQQEEAILQQVQKLRQQAKNGNNVSGKIYNKFRRNSKMNISMILNSKSLGKAKNIEAKNDLKLEGLIGNFVESQTPTTIKYRRRKMIQKISKQGRIVEKSKSKSKRYRDEEQYDEEQKNSKN